jgi:hypothetical protein
VTVLNPDHLFEQADRLISPRAGGARRQTDLRRAISDVYYAVFHAIVTAAADDFVGRTHRATIRYALLYRSIEHRDLRRLCGDIVKDPLPKRYSSVAPRDGFDPDLIAFATAFVDLQEKRYLADYDPLYTVRTVDALQVAATGRSALSRFKGVNRASRKAFLALVVFPPR